jgi:hypothetical protein
MWLPDYVLILNHFGGNLLVSEKTTLLKIPDLSLDQFLLISSRHLQARARVTTCFLNVLVARVQEFNVDHCAALIAANRLAFEPSILGALIQKIMSLQAKIPEIPEAKIDDWQTLLNKLREHSDTKTLRPLLKNLPMPKRKDPDFYQWGYAYPGIVLEPKKYLRPIDSRLKAS